MFVFSWLSVLTEIFLEYFEVLVCSSFTALSCFPMYLIVFFEMLRSLNFNPQLFCR